MRRDRGVGMRERETESKEREREADRDRNREHIWDWHLVMKIVLFSITPKAPEHNPTHYHTHAGASSIVGYLGLFYKVKVGSTSEEMSQRIC